jgi:hypothetical protein
MDADSNLLSRSELNALRRAADRWPIESEERREAVEHVLFVVRNAKSFRHKLNAIKCLVAMDNTNLNELRVLISAESNKVEALRPAPQVNVQVNLTNPTMHELAAMLNSGQQIPKEVVDKLTDDEITQLLKTSK